MTLALSTTVLLAGCDSAPVRGPAFDAAPDRIERHIEASDYLLKLNFYSQGKGMLVSPGLFEKLEEVGSEVDRLEFMPALLQGRSPFSEKTKILRAWGVQSFATQEKPVGIFEIRDRGLRFAVAGCVLCHAGKAAGVEAVGLGNKSIDLHRLAKDLLRDARVWQKLRAPSPNPEYARMENYAIEFLERMSRPQFDNLTRGLVSTAPIREWFYRTQGQALPSSEPIAQTKVPHWWGFGEKRKVGIDWDGFGEAREHLGWMLGVELAAGQDPEEALRLLPKAKEALARIESLLPPPYPFEIDFERAHRGKSVFEQSCARCHGEYRKDPQGFPIYEKPKRVSLRAIGTDPDRLVGNTPAFISLVETNPIARELKRAPDYSAGYVAPRLEGVWARFPYLHNGSVPSLRALLTRPDKRPTFWSVENAGERERFDPETNGLTLPERGSTEYKALSARALSGDRDAYTITRTGHGNRGHWFGNDQPTDPERIRDLIEYLKTL